MNFLKQPLLHFLFLGGALFFLYSWIGDEENSNQTKEIVITPGRIETLEANFEKVWSRPPTEKELDALINDFVTEEVYYREAMAIGLDQDDTIIRRRMRQKMEFITADLTEQIEPTEKELSDFLEENKESYQIDPVFSFKQVYLNPDNRKQTIEQDVQDLLAQLNKQVQPANVEEIGDRIMIDSSFESKAEFEIDRLFGTGFGNALTEVQIRKWQGPLRSGYGLHLVYVSDRTVASYPELEEIRSAVTRDWTSAKTRETNEQFVEALKGQYIITIQKD